MKNLDKKVKAIGKCSLVIAGDFAANYLLGKGINATISKAKTPSGKIVAGGIGCFGFLANIFAWEMFGARFGEMIYEAFFEEPDDSKESDFDPTKLIE